MYEYVTADIAGTQTFRSLVLREGFKMLQKKSTMIPRPTRGLGRSDHDVLGKTALHIFLWEEYSYVTAKAMDPTSLQIPQHTFLDITHLHSARVADAANLYRCWLSNGPRLSACI
jgi:hypothetical protein